MGHQRHIITLWCCAWVCWVLMLIYTGPRQSRRVTHSEWMGWFLCNSLGVIPIPIFQGAGPGPWRPSDWCMFAQYFVETCGSLLQWTGCRLHICLFNLIYFTGFCIILWTRNLYFHMSRGRSHNQTKQIRLVVRWFYAWPITVFHHQPCTDRHIYMY